eukprot:5483531-Amphidinium_carterae.1
MMPCRMPRNPPKEHKESADAMGFPEVLGLICVALLKVAMVRHQVIQHDLYYTLGIGTEGSKLYTDNTRQKTVQENQMDMGEVLL